MFVKLAVFVYFSGCALAQHQQPYQGPLAGGQPASLYPAGVNPQSCPNYPDCTNPLVAISQDANPQYAQATSQYQPSASQYEQPAHYQQYQASVPAAPSPVSQYNPVYSQQYAPASRREYSSEVQQRLDRGEYIGDGDYRGEGLAEALAPGYAAQPQAAVQYNSPVYQRPQQYNAVSTYQSAQPAQIPAGVNAQACPNYPFCHA
ncbi:AP2-associated protein kinase 1-like [Euwallacea fornicatus]|uniref:AP2-associated protein kinase 1-like n=1 Tax=Euwallacea fornicatus TaxID=995702 RepID=UPI00338FA11B